MLVSAWLVCPLSAFALEPEIQAAKDEGMRLWGQHEWIKMQPYLEQAAEADDVEAMYYLGEATRLLGRGLTEEAMGWYLKAAEQGDPYAMLRLFEGGACIAGDECPEDAEGWSEKALAETLPRAEAGDTDAMLALYHVYRLMDDRGEGVDWLEKSAEQGNPEAQTRLGKSILDGQGWYFLKSRRLEAAEEWFRKAAEQGYVPAMSQLYGVLSRQGNSQNAWHWLIAASEAGHRDSRINLGWCYLNKTQQLEGLCYKDENPVLGWAILTAVDIGMNGDSTSEDVMEMNQGRLGKQEKEEAEALAEECVNKQPPLSNFPPRFGF
ncbi:Sel1 repeat protein [Halomonas elongata]|uniref:Sel1 repeat protein n=1 Tax=Halomonas elongata TaxID=2746 RepID=A0A1B8P148_HALEL|nr:tetratricopeptide repeat protein [Halomonas elongata]OBX35972.1 Sel1 repeat protein [Halomonas elongata]